MDSLIKSENNDLKTIGEVKKLVVKNDLTNRIRVESRLKGELPTNPQVSNLSDEDQNILGTSIYTARRLGVKV